jgi:5,5'-dehydrodivanillate O-demethylase
VPWRFSRASLGENLVLFRDQQNGLGLIDRHCPHRGVSLACGIPESNGLRCPYHGWLFDRTGRCLERPFEDHNRQAGIAVPHQLRIQSYPLHVHGGLIFAYLGTEPAPICPDWGLLARTDIHRQIRISVTPCNWFQIMENALDPIHHEWLHGHFASYAKARQSGSLDYPREALAKWSHVAIRFRRFAYGIYKCRLVAGEDTVSEQWTTGHPIIFPNLAWFQSRLFWRVPIDDRHTQTVTLIHRPLEPAEAYREDPDFEPEQAPALPESGLVPWNTVGSTSLQDQLIWRSQGEIVDRSKEHLGLSDQGILMLRQLFFRQLRRLGTGIEPMNIFHDPAHIDLSLITCAPTLRASTPLG